ncbi:hypothetical protein EDB81DRAFT_932643 [Dactylonectria macrodidyma]|uniref:Uncharacterized protein n=1 Tax=Dactylonectria macrodidyma TaxID=307937 RepID=A0A9P9EXL6_9HYPO|nr:hypothetical protein EDB81DRAFT_932643 [Dactylonectria macrodidyma]
MADPRPSLPRLDTHVSCDEPPSERLIQAVAQTLDIPRGDIMLFDSFADLGGDQGAAEALRLACRRKGIEARADDIMGCHTLAELQTRITPFPPVSPIEASNPATSEEEQEDESGPSSMTASVDDIFSPVHRYSVSSYGSMASSNDSCLATRPAGRDLESVLKSSPQVSNVCLVTPRAGPFDGQLVALVKMADSDNAKPTSSEISLPLRSQHAARKRDITSLRTAVQEWGADSRRPQIWIPLTAMAEHDDGESDKKRPDARALQTWVQNINEAAYEDIMKLQIPEPRRPVRSQHREQHRRSWVESRRSIWDSDEAARFDCDEMECFPLAPMQQLYFQTAMRHLDDPGRIAGPEYRHSQSMLLRIRGGADSADVEAAVEAMVARHAMLRVRFRPVHDEWVQVVIPQASNSYRFGRHADVDEEELTALIQAAQASLDPKDGPVFAVEHVRNDNEQLLYLVAHRLVVDLISWRIMVHDLDELLREGTLLSEGSIPFPHWVDYQSYEMSQRLFEPTLPFDVVPADLDYWHLGQDANRHGDMQQVTFTLSSELSEILHRACSEVLRTDSGDVFLASLLLSFRRVFTDRRPPTAWKREHGREAAHSDFNVMETVGWFASLCPVGVSLEPETDLIQVIKLVKDTRRAIPRDGVPFFTAEANGPTSSGAGPVELVLNWVDALQGIQRQDGILHAVPVPGLTASTLRSDIGPGVGRAALFEVSAMTDDSGTRVDFTYSQNTAHQEQIQTWVQGFEHLLLEAIGRLRYHEPELTLGDVPLLRTSYKALARLGADRFVGAGLPAARDIETIYPVTPAQQEILMAQSQRAESFHVHAVYELQTTTEGTAVDATRLCKAWEGIVASKPALRSVFIDSVSREGLFDQVVLKKTSPSMLFLESSKPDEALARVPALKTPPMEPRHRLSVCHTSAKTMVRVDINQAICDLTSVHNLMAELCSVYSGQATSHNEALHRTYLYHVSSLDTAYSLEVWKTHLSGVKPCLFPRLSPSAADNTPPHPFALEVTRSQLTSFCDSRCIQPAAVLQLAWALVLRAFVGADRVTFGFQHAGRDEELLRGIGRAVGSFAGVLPCAVDVGPDRSVGTCLTDVDEALANARKHQNLTMAEIQHALRLRDGNLFNTCLSFEDGELFSHNDDDDHSLDLSQLTPSMVTASRKTDSQLSLTTAFLPSGNLHASLSARFLSDNQQRSVMGSFERAVKTILESPPAQLVAQTDLFTDRDYAQLVLHDWEAGQRSQRVEACLHEVVLQHALARPHAPAVCAWDGDLTYAQVATLVARLRTYLVNLGVGPGMAVPVVLEKNRWAPVMLLAVMQAGAAFVALDLQDLTTVQSTMRHLNPPIALATEAAWTQLGGSVPNLVIVNDAFFATLPPRNSVSPASREPSPDHAACAFVTPRRTSSGASRSIFFTHAALVSAFAAQAPALGLGPASRVLQLSAFNVDISLVEVLGALAAGACVCVPAPRDRARDLAGAMARMGVTWTYMTNVLARRIAPDAVPSLRTLCFRTRKLGRDTYGPWLDAGRSVLLAYGAPDVCPLGISVAAVTAHADPTIIPPPLAGRFWVLNPDDPRKLMPVGAVGELAIDSPAVTPHRFSRDSALIAPPRSPAGSPTSSSSGRRYLKTGHRVRYLDDGTVQFISSARDDVTVDGSSVDVADVEQRIRRCLGPGVDVVVDKIATADSLRVLAAFLELNDALFDGSEGLDNVSPRVRERTFIAKKLFEASLDNHVPGEPRLLDHCVPAVFIPLKAFPLSTSLKVNRRKLLRAASGFTLAQLDAMAQVPNPGEIQRVVLAQKPLPLTRPEEVMRSVWARVLAVPVVDIRGSSSFVSVGGNRFLASELVVACRRVGLKVSLSDIFSEATLTEMCASTTSDAPKRELSKSSDLTPIKGFSSKFIKNVIAPKLQCPAQHVLDVAEASSEQVRSLELAMYTNRADVVCLVLRFSGRVGADKLEAACRALTALHPALGAAFVLHEHRVYQATTSSFRPEFKKLNCSSAQLDNAAEDAVKKDQSIEFRPHVPVTGFTYIDAGEEGALVIRLSKAQIDDASVSLIVQDLTALYQDASEVEPASSIYEYARAAKTASDAGGIEYWTAQLDGAQMTHVVSGTAPRPPTSRVQSVRQTIKISSLSGRGISPDTIIKAAWATVLATVSGRPDVLFGETVQGHHVKLPAGTGLSSLVGPLINTVPVRVRFLGRHSTPLELMRSLQAQRRASRRFEAVGVADMARRCAAQWAPWTRFSTVVHHQASAPADGSATLNIGSTPFTYKTVEPEAVDLPDMLVCSTMETAERINIDIKFAEDRVSSAFAEECMRLLVAALETLTYRDTVAQPMLQSAEEIQRSEKRIPFLAQDSIAVPQVPIDHLLLPEQRAAIESAIAAAWDEALKPVGSEEHPLYPATFYSRANSLLPAYALAEKLNQTLPRLDIGGIDTVSFTAEDIIQHPTQSAQLTFIASLLRDSGAVTLPLRRKTTGFKPTPAPITTTVSSWRPKSSSGSPAPSLGWRNSIRLLRSRDSVRGLSIKTPSWKRHRDHGGVSPVSDDTLVSPITAPPSAVRETGPEFLDIGSLSGLFTDRNSSSSDGIIKTIIKEERIYRAELPAHGGEVSPVSSTTRDMPKQMWSVL